MAKHRQVVKQIDICCAVEHATDSNTKSKLEVLDVGYTALVTEVFKDNQLEGTLLYIPGVSFKTLRGK